MLIRIFFITLFVCALSQVNCEKNEISIPEIIKILQDGKSSTPTPITTSTTPVTTSTAAPKKGGLSNFAGTIVNNTKHAIHYSSNIVLGGVKNVGNVIQGGWNIADNVVDGSLDFAKKMGALGYKIVTVVPKAVNNVLLDVVKKGQDKLAEKLKNHKKTPTSVTATPTMMPHDNVLWILINGVKYPISDDQIIELADAIKKEREAEKKKPKPDVIPKPEEPYFLLVDEGKAHILTADDLIEIGEEFKKIKEEEAEKKRKEAEKNPK
ncbi:uncharacterized protein LOC130671419 [Microplitis mediator]|uniref:uncharacterized protein LOC130671419 n=1 Tax=Microplitis mediator TaxID=375433 RepID=UPI0025572363|nr:uncharacterized protein LOC130671419 [Microplitis mediator]